MDGRESKGGVERGESRDHEKEGKEKKRDHRKESGSDQSDQVVSLSTHTPSTHTLPF